MLKARKKTVDNIPIKDTTPAIKHSTKLLAMAVGVGASFGTVPPMV